MTPEQLKRLERVEQLLANHKHLLFDATKPLDLTPVFAGKINTAGSSVFLPTGWTSAKNASGDYTITHNFNTTSYSVSALVTGVNQDFICMIKEHNANTFKIITTHADGGAGFDADICFIVAKS